MKKFIHVYENEIVARYENEIPQPFGGPYSSGVSIEVPEKVDLQLAEVQEDVEGELYVYQRELSEEEQFQKEVEESQPYVGDIQKGQRAIAFFRLLNDKKGLNKTQKKQALANVTLQSITQLLSLGKLPDAVEMINAIEADGKIVTEEDKKKMVRFLGE